MEYFSILLTNTKETLHEIITGMRNLLYSEGIIKEIRLSFKSVFSLSYRLPAWRKRMRQRRRNMRWGGVDKDEEPDSTLGVMQDWTR